MLMKYVIELVAVTPSPLLRILQSFILREQSGTLAPAAHDEHKARHVKKGGVMATVFTGGKAKGHREQEMTFELSLEMNRKMQSVLEDTLLKNITLKVCQCMCMCMCACVFLL